MSMQPMDHLLLSYNIQPSVRAEFISQQDVDV
jgi:hypothetical protein